MGSVSIPPKFRAGHRRYNLRLCATNRNVAMPPTRSLFAVVLSLVTVSVAIAKDAPQIGKVYGEKVNGSLSYTCSLVTDSVLSCDFVETYVGKQKEAADWAEEIARAKQKFLDVQKKPSSYFYYCDPALDLIAAALQGGPPRNIPPDLKRQFDSMSAMERQDRLATIRAYQNICKKRTEAAFLESAKVEFSKALRTCRVISSTFNQQFRWVDGSGGNGAWVVSAPPEGPCGIVQLSRFERAPKSDKASNYWNYFSRRAITNPKGSLFGLMKCSKMDQETNTYTYLEPSEANMKCDYIMF